MIKDVEYEVEQRDLHATNIAAETKKEVEVYLDNFMRVDDDDDQLLERQIYSLDEQENNFLCDDVIVNGSSSMFYTTEDNNNNFPPLNNVFPCMSSSSSSSSLPPQTNPLSTITAPIATPSCSSTSSSSSSAVSWAVLKSETEDYHNRSLQEGVVVNDINIAPIHGSICSSASVEVFSASQNGISGINVMEDFGCLDLQIEEEDDIWDPSSIFLNESNISQQEDEQKMFVPDEEQHQREYLKEENNNNYDDHSNGFDFLQGNSELSAIFLDWLKQNKDFISAEEMRSITLKRSTIESAMKRLGNSNEGKKHLLKLILEWVENCRLQKKKINSENSLPSYQQQQFHASVQNPNPDPNVCFPHSLWPMAANAPPAFAPESGVGLVTSPQGTVFQPAMGYMGDHPYACNGYMPQQAEFHQQMHNNPAHHCWQQIPQFPAQLVMPPPPQYVHFPPENNSGLSPPTPPQMGMYGGISSQYPYQGFDGNGEGLVRMGSSATKEARKKRMARQRRLSTHHFRHNNPSTNHQQNMQSQMQVNELQHVIRMNSDGGLNCSSPAAVATPPPPVGNWAYWSPSTGAVSASANVTMVPVGSPPRAINIDRTAVQRSVPTLTDRRQGYRTEKNLKFLLQKVLKQSDVGNLGRIVLPKKEAELHLPELESRDGIGIALEDIGTSRIWNMRYRMYLLENTGEFVRTNGLREGDFIVLYSDTKCGKYMIRGVKVRQQQGLKPEGKKPIKRNIRKIASAFNDGAPHCAPITQAVMN
ncbi:hypothetical protein Leryth_014291 [Lithospermum erythrorhizon]|nr:hypothetical protein Leryth_014291 [Lithospermum erythrorhizon]